MLNPRVQKFLEQLIKNEKIIVDKFIVEYILEKVFDFLKEEKQYSIRQGYQLFRSFMEYILMRNRSNYDSMILITGQKGAGKSSTGLMMIKFWSYLLDIRLDLNKSLVYSNTQLMNAIDELPKFYPILADEAVDFASAQNWNKRENKYLKLKLAKIRTKHLFFILCWPWKIDKLDKIYFESYINYWIDLFGRGYGAVFVKDLNPVSDPWKLDYFKKIGTFNEFTNIEKIRDIYRKHPNFWELIRFPMPSESYYNEYLKIREKNIYHSNDLKHSFTTQDVSDAFIIKSFEDIYMKQSTLGFKRLLKHIKERYNYSLKDTDLKASFKNAQLLINKVVEDEIFKKQNKEV